MSTRFDRRRSNHFVSTHTSGHEGGGDMTARKVDAVTGSEKLASAINALLQRRAKA